MLGLLFALLALPWLAQGGRFDYCKQHTFITNATYMQYNKELIEAEYAVQNQFKAIHCCGKGYRSIEWFKDGVAYPWQSTKSNLILYPEAANQTLYTTRVSSSDSGNYTCRMRNDTHHVDHTITLEVTEMPTDKPRITVTPNDKTAELGSEVRFYCEAFVGRVNLPDAHSDIKWHRKRGNDNEAWEERRREHFVEIPTIRENEDIVGAYLYIDRVLPEDYGQYECVVRSNDVVSSIPVTLLFADGRSQDANELGRAMPWRMLLVCALLGGVAGFSALVLYKHCWPRLALAARLMMHERRNIQQPTLPDKEYDVLVVCTAVDRELTRGALLLTLAVKYHYRTAHLELSTQPDTWYTQIIEKVRSCRSLVCVLSPAQHSPAQLLTALKQLRALPVPPVIVLLQDLPKLRREAKDERGECLVSLLRRTKLLAWRHLQDRAFWTNLRLALPLPPPLHLQIEAAARVAAPRIDTTRACGLNMVEMAHNKAGASRSNSLDALV